MNAVEKFNMMANRYDTEERMQIAKIIADNIKEQIFDGQNKSVIDFGCGTGLVGLELVNDVKEITFVDASPNMIEEVNKKIEKLNVKNAKTLACDVMVDDVCIKADYVIISQTLLHIKDVNTILCRLREMLNVDGHIIIVDFDKNNDIVSDDVHNGFDRDEIIKEVSEIGFDSIVARTFYHGEKVFMKQDASMFLLDGRKI